MKCKLTVPISLTVIARARVNHAKLTADPALVRESGISSE